MSNLRGLTQRELEVLKLLTDCKSNKEIAKQLFVSEKTVEFHLANLYSKLGVKTRLEAAVWALQQQASLKN